jgi:hypothetical protein
VNLLALVLAQVIHYREEDLERKKEKRRELGHVTGLWVDPGVPRGRAAFKAQGATTANFSPEHMGVDMDVETKFFGERFP